MQGRVLGSGTRLPTIVGLIALYAVATAYNLSKAYHLDDVAHLVIAQWIAGHPLHPMSGILNWSGLDEPIWHTNQPHLLFYLYAGWGSLFGFGEGAMHAFQSLFTLAAILLFHRLATGIGLPRPLLATALFVLNPALIVEQNLMVDVPLTAVWLGFFACLILGRRSDRQDARWIGAALLCGAALLIKYSSLALLPLLGGALLYERQWRRLWIVAIPLGLLVAWSAFNHWDYGGIHILDRPVEAKDRLRPLVFAIAWVLALGALVPLGLTTLLRAEPLRAWRRPICIVVAAGLLVMVGLVATGLRPAWQVDAALHVVAMANGLLIVGLTLLAGYGWWRGAPTRDYDRVPGDDRAVPLYLVAWIMATTGFYVVLTPFVAARHLLLILPAIILLLLHWRQGRGTLGLDLFALAATAVLALGLAITDWRWANFYRESVPAVAAHVPATGTRWVRGHWGLQWYAMQNGFRPIDVNRSALRPGDVVLSSPDVYAEPLAHPVMLRPIATVEQPEARLNLFCTGLDSRFYHSDIRHLPWRAAVDCNQHLILSVVR